MSVHGIRVGGTSAWTLKHAFMAGKYNMTVRDENAFDIVNAAVNSVKDLLGLVSPGARCLCVRSICATNLHAVCEFSVICRCISLGWP